jgi:ADP-ribosylglycohydrolase
MLGAIFGDIAGSTREFRLSGAVSGAPFAFDEGSRFTDDTVCTVAVMDALLRNVPDAELATHLRNWCRRYPGRGYGGMFRQWLDGEISGPYGSFGNGAVMRISPVALLSSTLAEAFETAERITAVTHNHPESVRAVRCIVEAIWIAREGAGGAELRDLATRKYGYRLAANITDMVTGSTCQVSCMSTVPRAIVCAADANDFLGVIDNCLKDCGDIDTLAATACPIAEARFGMPGDIREATLMFLSAEMRDTLRSAYGSAPPHPRH